MKKSTSSGPTQLFRRRARALKRHLPAALAGDHRGVHRARVATRRLREAVPVLAAGLGRGQAAKASRRVRRLTRALGPVRELDVTLRLLDELTRNEAVHRAAVEEVRARVVADRDEKQAAMLERLGRVNAAKLNRGLSSVVEALGSSVDDGWRTVLSARLLKRSRRLAEAVDAAGQIYEPEHLHRVRIAAKKLRYGLELAADSGLSSAAPHVRAIKRVQDLLGRLHDLQVLQSHVAAVQASPAAGRPGIATSLAALAEHIEAECRHLHGRYIVSADGLHHICAAVSAEVIPQIHPGARRPLRMSLAARQPAKAASGGRR